MPHNHDHPGQDSCCSTDGKKGCCGMKMCKNVGMMDRLLRVAVGSVLVTLTVTAHIGVWGWLGAIVLVTGLMGWCGAYALLGLNTMCCGRKKECCNDKGPKTEGSSCCSRGSCDTKTPPAAE